MGRFSTILVLLAFFGWGCAHRSTQPNTSSYRTDQSITELNRIANSQELDTDQRAKAVFALFANFVHAGQAQSLDDVFIDTGWFVESTLHPYGILGGSLPIGMGDGDSTAFGLFLFPKSSSGWTVFFRLSGPSLSKEQGWRFFNGESQSLTIEEFCLRHHSRPSETRFDYYEHFSKKGMRAFNM